MKTQNETLTTKNAHLVSTIINKNNPEWGTKAFTYVAGDNSFFGRGSNSAMLFEHSFQYWEVASWK
jgi:hypothetical protein